MCERGTAADHFHQPRRFTFDVRCWYETVVDGHCQRFDSNSNLGIFDVGDRCQLVELDVLVGDRHQLVSLRGQRRGDLAQGDARDVWIDPLAQQRGVTRADDDLYLVAASDAAHAKYAKSFLEDVPAHDSAALVMSAAGASARRCG